MVEKGATGWRLSTGEIALVLLVIGVLCWTAVVLVSLHLQLRR